MTKLKQPCTGLCLNAPFGARCFLTHGVQARTGYGLGLNAPFGARCFLTSDGEHALGDRSGVLMHRLALRALCYQGLFDSSTLRAVVLMHRLALGAF